MRNWDAALGDRAPSLDDLPKLAYTGHVITESLRLYPAAWGMARLAVEDHEIAGYPVTKGNGRGHGAVGGASRPAMV